MQLQEETKIPWFLKPFFWNQKRKYGKHLDAALVWARHPKLFTCVAMLYGAIDSKKSSISPPLRSLITVRISQINWCSFCVDINSETLLKRGVSEEKLLQLENWSTSPLFSPLEKAVLNFSEKVTLSSERVTPEDHEVLRQYLDENDIIELTALIAFQNMSSKFNEALGVQPQGFCRVPNVVENVQNQNTNA